MFRNHSPPRVLQMIELKSRLVICCKLVLYDSHHNFSAEKKKNITIIFWIAITNVKSTVFSTVELISIIVESKATTIVHRLKVSYWVLN